MKENSATVQETAEWKPRGAFVPRLSGTGLLPACQFSLSLMLFARHLASLSSLQGNLELLLFCQGKVISVRLTVCPFHCVAFRQAVGVI